jgi:tight adherence protein C
VGARLERRWPVVSDYAARLIGTAGLAGKIAPAELVGWKAVGVAAGVGAGFLSFPALQPWSLLLVIILVPLGWFAPDLWVAHRRRARTRDIEISLSTVMDLLALSLEAGMGLERALRMICDRVDSPLTEELRHVLSDVGLGISRREAFARMAQRVRLEEIRSLTAAIIQAEELSASLVSAMRVQSHQVRLSRRHRAEAEALRAPVKMMIPMVLFTLPALFIILLGPVVLQFMHRAPPGT